MSHNMMGHKHQLRRIEPDGTRVYSNYEKYKPVAPEDRKYKGAPTPDSVRFHGTWFTPMSFVPEDQRVVPETKPDDTAYRHALVTMLCRCAVCVRPEAVKFRKRAANGKRISPGRPWS